MKWIFNSSDDISEAIGTQYYDQSIKYKILDYVIEEKIDDGYLLYNTMSRKIIFLSLDEYEEYKKVLSDGNLSKLMVVNWFYIPENMESKTINYMQRQSYFCKYPRKRFGKLKVFTIMTTYDCNARCPYCYEADYPHITMSDKITNDTADYIVKKHGGKIKLRWFGGEPLVNAKCINAICQRMKDENIKYESRMVSNGYLFHKFSKETIVDLWHLKSLQITLDGTETNYNRIKSYVNVGNAYQQVIKNILYLLQLGITVTIRLNVSRDNYADLNTLVDQLYDWFHMYKDSFTVYSHALFEDCGNPPLVLTEEERRLLYEQSLSLQKKINALGIGSTYSVRGIPRVHCMADDGRSVVINPNGDLSLCEHYANEDIVGSIYSDDMNKDLIIKWQTHFPGNDRCPTCPNLPQCNKLYYCPSGQKCLEEDQKFELYRLHQAMLTTYIRHKNNSNQPVVQTNVKQIVTPIVGENKQKVIDIAKNELGYSCKRNEVSKYMKYFYDHPSSMPWCMYFIQWCFCMAFGNDAGYKILRVSMPYQKILKYSMHFFNQKATTSIPEIGCIMFIKNEGSWFNHIGLVIDINNDEITTIEGNVMDSDGTGYVKQVTRNLSEFKDTVRFGIPKYEILLVNE